tara:strand:+ start:1971 stop:2174 length:204 start_codon:yes stop_codon:yes gene_type:complete
MQIIKQKKKLIKMIKLKKIIKESQVWERNFGEPLPVLDWNGKAKKEKVEEAKVCETCGHPFEKKSNK